ncbi:azurin [Alteromonas sp. ASW11-19]|uniref:Azurin n=1 Tax=Alteromonas salexigens TaxID=2982530 RepID=A0ABT2VN91_9ALTE|nr:azurin [Alteromonas salexigens]MCU7554781.1 azurin [Alteromonas salexigens]
MKLKNILFGALLLGASGTTLANECETTIDSNDMMKFDTSEMTIPKSCGEYTVTLTHSGNMGKAAMGHNWVMSKKADMQGIAQDGMTAGLDNNYIKQGDERVIANTKVIGGGEETSVTFDVSGLSADESYMFFCSFPGHIAMMKGTVTVK